MTKSQNTKDEQQKDLCITSEQLTEKWKKGELPDGHYYVKDGENLIAELLDGYFYNNGEPMTSFTGGVDEVLAPVPSYEEYQKLLSDQLAKNEGVEINAELEAENTKLKTENKWYSEQLNDAVKEVGHLKELLTMVKPVLQLEYNVTGNRNLIKKINQVLGE